MELLRYSTDAWGREILLGVSWEPLWAPAAAAFAVIAAHQLTRYFARRARRGAQAGHGR